VGQSRLEIDPLRLEEIIRFFQGHKYEFISPDQLPSRLLKPERHRKFILFTFDDGYLDNLTHAYPIFQKYNIPFTIYVATSFPEGNAVLWWYLLDDLILAHDHLSFTLPDGQLELDCSTPEKKTNASRYLRGKIKYASPEAFKKIIHSVFKPYQIDLYAKTRELALNWSQIRELDRDPLVTIGSHSMHHFPLQVLGQAEARQEIEQSKTILEQQLEHPVNHFAYPFGERREAGKRDFEFVRQSGYTTAVTTRFANLFPGHKHHLESLPRFDVPALDSDEKMEYALNGLLQIRRNRFRRVVAE
jgi:peptidoglycan/xylan/chitin deacetylase (PgdA/CDA1 family)